MGTLPCAGCSAILQPLVSWLATAQQHAVASLNCVHHGSCTASAMGTSECTSMGYGSEVYGWCLDLLQDHRYPVGCPNPGCQEQLQHDDLAALLQDSVPVLQVLLLCSETQTNMLTCECPSPQGDRASRCCDAVSHRLPQCCSSSAIVPSTCGLQQIRRVLHAEHQA